MRTNWTASLKSPLSHKGFQRERFMSNYSIFSPASYMRCAVLCPEHARDFKPIVMAGTEAAMAPKLGGHKKNHLFL